MACVNLPTLLGGFPYTGTCQTRVSCILPVFVGWVALEHEATKKVCFGQFPFAVGWVPLTKGGFCEFFLFGVGCPGRFWESLALSRAFSVWYGFGMGYVRLG